MSTPTIIDRHEARRIACGSLVVLSAWFVGMAALALIVDPVAVIAFGPYDRISQAVVSADASVIAIGRGFIVARADAAGLPRRLYAGGAWLVWPALTSNCGSKYRLADQRS